MILRGNQARFQRWCLDTYGKPRPLRWLKDRLFEIALHHYERQDSALP
jgi:hypothetical protein